MPLITDYEARRTALHYRQARRAGTPRGIALAFSLPPDHWTVRVWEALPFTKLRRVPVVPQVLEVLDELADAEHRAAMQHPTHGGRAKHIARYSTLLEARRAVAGRFPVWR